MFDVGPRYPCQLFILELLASRQAFVKYQVVFKLFALACSEALIDPRFKALGKKETDSTPRKAEVTAMINYDLITKHYLLNIIILT